MGGGSKIPYPKHVWSPAGGWYSQPANWKRNTAVVLAGMFFQVALIWKISSEREQWARKPEPGEFYFSRYYNRQMKEWDAEDKRKEAEGKAV